MRDVKEVSGVLRSVMAGVVGIRISMQVRVIFICLFFFFSSRRRHTRFTSDWSSDVCSSDLRWIMNGRVIVPKQFLIGILLLKQYVVVILKLLIIVKKVGTVIQKMIPIVLLIN